MMFKLSQQKFEVSPSLHPNSARGSVRLMKGCRPQDPIQGESSIKQKLDGLHAEILETFRRIQE